MAWCAYLTQLKQQPEYAYLNEVPAVALQQSLKRLADAFKAFFGNGRKVKSGFPKFRSKYFRQSFTLVGPAFRIRDGKVYMAKSPEPLNILFHRELPSEPTSVTISLEPTGRYFISFTCEYQPKPSTGKGIVGLDLGLKDIVTMSNGVTIPNPKHYIQAALRLGRLQRQLSRKKPGSKNRTKARLKVAKLHAHIANQRKDYLHKVTSMLISENQAIVIENLMVAHMARNRHLSKAIMTACWGMFRQMLTYKAIHSGHTALIIADQWYPSSQLCNRCGTKPSTKLKLATRVWTCPTCHTTHQRDANASQNLANIALNHPQLWKHNPGEITFAPSYKALQA